MRERENFSKVERKKNQMSCQSKQEKENPPWRDFYWVFIE